MSRRWDAKTMTTPRRVVHCIAQCKNCDWNDDGFKDAARKASRHSREKGHAVLVEQGVTYTVKPN